MASIILKTFNHPIEANLAKDLLQEQGIPCFLTNELNSQMLPHLNGLLGAGIQLIVDESNAEQATALLAAHQNEPIMHCPNCQSANIQFGLGEQRFKKIFTIFLSLFLFIPFGNIRNTFYCKECKKEFRG
ncbi:MAG: DUF2007 domain-containing protein [Bacteroidota bacterium]|nr:DUF2007 domain-containing protein [Bacteroidota bacterium]MDX5429675.1 DUF2007 domain-containing protein [Bacteroidota bacterium]MDX5468453.1 DUF2007 domain-containing protein [Bacteroidota bacterium]